MQCHPRLRQRAQVPPPRKGGGRVGVWGWGGGAICVRVPARLPFARACPRLPAQPRLACALILVTLTGLHIGVPRSLRGSVPRDLKGRACVPRGSRARACVRASVLVSVGLSSSTLSLSLSAGPLRPAHVHTSAHTDHTCPLCISRTYRHVHRCARACICTHAYERLHVYTD